MNRDAKAKHFLQVTLRLSVTTTRLASESSSAFISTTLEGSLEPILNTVSLNWNKEDLLFRPPREVSCHQAGSGRALLPHLLPDHQRCHQGSQGLGSSSWGNCKNFREASPQQGHQSLSLRRASRSHHRRRWWRWRDEHHWRIFSFYKKCSKSWRNPLTSWSSRRRRSGSSSPSQRPSCTWESWSSSSVRGRSRLSAKMPVVGLFLESKLFF